MYFWGLAHYWHLCGCPGPAGDVLTKRAEFASIDRA